MVTLDYTNKYYTMDKENTIQASIVIFSHLSDVQESINMGIFGLEDKKRNNTRLNFSKWLLLKYDNIRVRIDPDEEFELFKKEHPTL
jgi:hypothetical protein